jgi:hypothetical protein
MHLRSIHPRMRRATPDREGIIQMSGQPMHQGTRDSERGGTCAASGLGMRAVTEPSVCMTSTPRIPRAPTSVFRVCTASSHRSARSTPQSHDANKFNLKHTITRYETEMYWNTESILALAVMPMKRATTMHWMHSTCMACIDDLDVCLGIRFVPGTRYQVECALPSPEECTLSHD